MSDNALPVGGSAATRTVTGVAVACCGAAAALTALGVANGSKLLALLPVALTSGIILAVIALTQFRAFVLVMLLTRASIDATKLAPRDALAQLLTPSTIIGVLFTVAAALWLVANYRARGRLPGSGLRTALVALVVVSAVSVPNAVNVWTSLGEVVRLLAIVMMYVVLEQLELDPRMMRRVLVAVFCSAIVPVLYTGFGFLVGHPPVEVKDGVTRVVGTFVQSNNFGAYLMLLVIVGVALLPQMHGRARGGLVVLLAACGVCLVLTYTLAALSGALIGLVVVGVKQSKRLLLVLATVLVCVPALAPSLSERLTAVSSTSTYAADHGNSLAWRLVYWSQIIHLADSNPLTGVGYGMTPFITQQGKQPHNDYLRAFVETGLVGLTVYLVVITLLIRVGVRAVRVAPPNTLERSVAVGYLGCAVAFAVTSFTANEISGVAQLWYLIAFAAAASGVLRRAGGGPHPESRARTRDTFTS